MTTKSKPTARFTVPRHLPQKTPCTTQERLQRIEAMGQRIHGYIQFMCQAANLSAASAEVRERAVATFYEQLIVVERQLGRIHDDLQLE